MVDALLAGFQLYVNISNVSEFIINNFLLIIYVKVKEESSETGKKGFIAFKNAVYHSSFKQFLSNIAELSYVGSSTMCADEIVRSLWPFILILSADYEELCVSLSLKVNLTLSNFEILISRTF